MPAQLPRVYADATHVERVLRNLVSNALKYAPKGGRVRVAAMRAGQGEVEVRFTSRWASCPAARVSPRRPSESLLDRAADTAQQCADRGTKNDQASDSQYRHQGNDESVFDQTLRAISFRHANTLLAKVSAALAQGLVTNPH